MKVTNYSAEPLSRLYSWLPRDLHAEEVVFLPDACPGKSPLPTGVAVRTRQQDWRKFALSDCGCGMLLARSAVRAADLDRAAWDSLYHDLLANKGRMGDLGSGNHFLDALQACDEDALYLLVHTGSRDESKAVEPLVDDAVRFDETFRSVCDWAKANRAEIGRMAAKYFGKLEPVLDLNHNSYEELPDGSVIIRKGAVKLLPGGTAVIPSNLNGAAVLVRAQESIAGALNSMSHGTGRIMSRSEAKEHAERYDYAALRKQVYIPPMISDASIRTEAPFCYRDLDSCLQLIAGLADEVKRFSPIAYLGQI